MMRRSICGRVAAAARSRCFSTMPKQPFYIIDSTLREGEQFSTAEFSSQDRIYIAKTLDEFGVDYIEVVNPMAGIQAIEDCEAIANLGLKAKILTHVRCHMADVELAVKTGVQGVNIYMATSSILAKHSHGKDLDEILKIAEQVIGYVKRHGLEVRFSCEDSFRSDKSDLLRIYAAIDALGVDRVGIADTVGVATPSHVTDIVSSVRGIIRPETGIEFHAHNDTGCCIANALAAVEAGATHIDTSVLGIGERNGIPSLGGFMARMYTQHKEFVTTRYNLPIIGHLDRYIAQRCDVSIPFNNYITGSSAFTHKAGVHSKAVMQNPGSYEVINPADFGVDRRIQVGHRLTGWNAMAQTAKDMGLDVSQEQIKTATVIIKNLSDTRKIGQADVETILRRLAGVSGERDSVFVHWSDESLSMQERLELAANELDEDVDMRPTLCLRVTGHLFDERIMNKIMDLAVDSPCDFRVVRMTVGATNDLMSTVILQLWGATMANVIDLRQELTAFCKKHEAKSNSKIVEYTMAMAMRDQIEALRNIKKSAKSSSVKGTP